MGDGLGSAFLIVVFGVALTAGLGTVLIRSGRAVLAEVYDDERIAGSVTRLVVVLFGLVVLGVVALLSTAELSTGGLAETALVKLGVMLLAAGAAYGLTLLVLVRIRSSRRDQQLADLTRAALQRVHRSGPPA